MKNWKCAACLFVGNPESRKRCGCCRRMRGTTPRVAKPEPVLPATIGEGATWSVGSDRYAGTVVKVTPKTIHVQEDQAVRIDKNGMSESQVYSYTPNPHGSVHVFRLTKRGWRSGCMALGLGHRSAYYDYSF